MNINEKTWDFVREHADEDVRKVALLGTKDPEVDLQMALLLIAGRQTARKKLSSWATVEGIVYPPHLNLEQCSSEQTARYKAGLVLGDGCWVLDDGCWVLDDGCRVLDDGCWVLGDSLTFVDLTGGFGVDFYWMSQAIIHHPTPNTHHPTPPTHHLIYVEQNEALCEIAAHNFALLGLKCSVCCCDAATYLARMPHADLIFLDPARRNEHGGRTYGIGDCTPNVLELMPQLLEKADRVMLKLSPMLDWRKAVDDIQHPSPTTHHPPPTTHHPSFTRFTSSASTTNVRSC